MLRSNLPAYYLNLDDSLPGFTTSVLRSGKPTRISRGGSGVRRAPRGDRFILI